MTWVACTSALPALDERVLISHPSRVEIAQRSPFDPRLMRPGATVPSFVWLSDDRRRTFDPREVTHWMPLPARP